MREIKFRAWDKKRKEIVPDLCDWAIYESKEGFELRLGEPIKNHIGGFTEGGGILMQSTGLKDKNGKEIYEGDVILGCSKVVWKEELSGFGISDGKYCLADYKYSDNFKVIGNIYENPNLLEAHK